MKKDRKFDAIIVGAGAGGATMAKELSEANMDVLVLEKGGQYTSNMFIPLDELYWFQQKRLTPFINDDPLVYENGNDLEEVDRWWVVNAIGGATMHWDANLLRYGPEDFDMLTRFGKVDGADIVDWPFDYNDLVPFFEKAEWEWGISGAVGQSKAQEPFSSNYQYPMPPLREHISTNFIKKILNKYGFEPYSTPKGINSDVYNGRPGTSYCGFCQNFGCGVDSRASAMNTMMIRALSTDRCEVRTHSYVYRILTENNTVTGVEYLDKALRRCTAQSDYVIIACQAIESARLFLLSKIGNSSNLVGKYLTYHTGGEGSVIYTLHPPWDEDIRYQKRLGTLTLRDLYTISDPVTPVKKGGKIAFYDPYTTTTPIALAIKTNLWGKDLKDRLRLYRNHRSIAFSFKGEAMPVASNNVTLDHKRKDKWGIPVARVHYEHHPLDLELSKYVVEKMLKILTDEVSGAKILNSLIQSKHNRGHGHQHGTLRAGFDPKKSVLNSFCESHEIKSLFVVDSSFMPTSGATNPGLTIIANSYRVADFILH